MPIRGGPTPPRRPSTRDENCLTSDSSPPRVPTTLAVGRRIGNRNGPAARNGQAKLVIPGQRGRQDPPHTAGGSKAGIGVYERADGRGRSSVVTVLRLGLGLGATVVIALQLGHSAAAVVPATDPRMFEPNCDPCVLVIDKAAWDETQTVVDREAYEESVTVVDTPASTGTRTIVDTPAHAVAH